MDSSIIWREAFSNEMTPRFGGKKFNQYVPNTDTASSGRRPVVVDVECRTSLSLDLEIQRRASIIYYHVEHLSKEIQIYSIQRRTANKQLSIGAANYNLFPNDGIILRF